MKFVIGSYTRLGGPGVAECELTAAGDFRVLRALALPNPTWQVLSRKNPVLFSTCSDPVHPDGGGSVASVGMAGKELELLSRVDTVGVGPCHLILSRDERFLYCANYFSGAVSVFPVDEQGKIGELIQLVQHEGHSVHPERQTGPHAHQLGYIPGTNLIWCCDLGLDAVMVYQQDITTGMLMLQSRFDAPKGAGPRHLIFRDLKNAYLANEVDSTVCHLTCTDGIFTLEKTLSTLPEGFDRKNTVPAIRLTSDGRTLLVSNRGHNSIARFSLTADGDMAPRDILPTFGDFPRDFNLIDDTTLLIGHQNGNMVLASLGDSLEKIRELELKTAVCVTLE